MRQQILLSLVIFIIVFLPAGKISAAEIHSDTSQTILDSPDSTFSVSVALRVNNSDNHEYFLRGVFYREGTTNYCGFTWNGSNWWSGPYTSGEGWKNFFPISMQESTWSGIIMSKIDPSDSGCSESGNYNFKIQRFSVSGSASFDDQNIISVSVTVPTKTPTPVPTVVPSNIPSPSPTQLVSTVTPSVFHATAITTKIILTQMPVNRTVTVTKETLSPTKTDIFTSAHPESSHTGILGIQSFPTPSESHVAENRVSRDSKYGFAFALIGIGSAILSGTLFWQKHIYAEKT